MYYSFYCLSITDFKHKMRKCEILDIILTYKRYVSKWNFIVKILFIYFQLRAPILELFIPFCMVFFVLQEIKLHSKHLLLL